MQFAACRSSFKATEASLLVRISQIVYPRYCFSCAAKAESILRQLYCQMQSRNQPLAFSSSLSLQISTFCGKSSVCRLRSVSEERVLSTTKRLRVFPVPALGKPSPRCSTEVGKFIESAASRTRGLVWSVGRSSEYKAVDAVKESIARASSTLVREGVEADLVLLFIKSRPENTPNDEMKRVIPVLRKTLSMKRLLTGDTQIFGCTSADYVEEENDPSVHVVLIHFPQETIVRPFTISDGQTFDIDWNQKQWHTFVGIDPATVHSETQDDQTKQMEKVAGNLNIFLLQHPDFEGMEDLLSGLDFAYPGIRKFGGLAGRANPLHNAYLFNSYGIRMNGVVGLALSSPNMQIDVTVAQGARGVGPLMMVTGVRDGNEICRVREIGTPTQAEAAPMTLLDMWSHTDFISQEDRRHASKYLLFGVEVQKIADMAVSFLVDDEDRKKSYGDSEEAAAHPFDMVIRKVVAFNESSKSLAVEGGGVRVGSRVQFQIRDEEAARSELALLLDKLRLEGSSKAMEGMSLMGAILLADTERGANLYGKVTPDLDRALYSERFPVPLALLTSEGQIGPLPAGGLLGAAGNTFTLSASALYVSIYGPSHEPQSPSAPELEN